MFIWAMVSPENFARTFRGLSKQSDLLCMTAPQFSQAPFLYFVEIFV
jgi:hypothetical protein